MQVATEESRQWMSLATLHKTAPFLNLYDMKCSITADVNLCIQITEWLPVSLTTLPLRYGGGGDNTHPKVHTHTHTFNGPLSRIIRVSSYQKGKTNLDFTEARDSEWQWH